MSVVSSGFWKLGFHLAFQTQLPPPLPSHTLYLTKKAIAFTSGGHCTQFCVIITSLISLCVWVLIYFHILFWGLISSPEPLAGGWRGRVEWWLETDFCPPWILNTIHSRISLLLLSGMFLANPQLGNLALCWACHLWPVLEESSAPAFHRTRCSMCWTNLLPPAAVSPSERIRL